MTKTEDMVPESVRALLERAEPAEVLVGILTFNNTTTIEPLLKTIAAGLQRYFGSCSGLIVSCDTGSQDGTPQQVEQIAAGGGPRTWTVPLHFSSGYSRIYTESGMPGRERAFRTILAIGERVAAKVCIILDGDLRSVTPEWIGQLGGPLYENAFDHVVPLYRRYKYDGTLTNGLLYPLSRALYGKRVRFPSGGGYGVSGKLASHLLAKATWEAETSRYGVDGWLTTTALAEGFQVGQTFLGPRVREGKPGSIELSAIFAQEVGCVFHQMEVYQTAWESVKGSADVPQFGPAYETGTEALPVHVDRMLRGFRQGLRDLLPVWDIILAPDTLGRVLSLGIEDEATFRYPMDLWVQTVYDTALAYHDKVLHREHLLKSVTPLYLGRTASLILETKDREPEAVERSIEALCGQFEAMKSYLVQRWRWQDE